MNTNNILSFSRGRDKKELTRLYKEIFSKKNELWALSCSIEKNPPNGVEWLDSVDFKTLDLTVDIMALEMEVEKLEERLSTKGF